MKYRSDKKGVQISQLGFGCMRFTRKGASIDFEKAEQEVMYAVEQGVNYFDTAYIYPGSEELMGKIFEKNQCRDQVYIATKLPQYLVRNMQGADKTFAEELKRLRTDYIDYYLMHMFTDIAEFERLKALGLLEWIDKKKASGEIRNIGFSYHGNSEMFVKILNVYDWDFCQIQYNYLDEYSQAGRIGLEAAEEKGIPVIIMEPLRGGKLVRIPDAAKGLCEARGFTPAELGLRWLWDQPGVTCILSGMNSLEMVQENIRIADSAEPGHMSPEDHEMVAKVRGIIREREKVGCTGCRYCMPCPKGVEIPSIFYFYNLMYMEDKKMAARFEYAQTMGMRKEPGFASQCVNCGKCEQHCPQGISIREMLKKADKELRPLPIKAGINMARKFMTRGKKE